MEGPKPVQSPADKKTYKYLKLSNGMSALLIHDPAVAISAGTEEHNAQQQQQPGSDCSSSDGDDKSEDSESEEGSQDDSDVDNSSGSSEDEEAGAAGRTSSKKPAASKKAAAAMAVGVGSFSDPSDMQGLSHYLEHMLFMGSQQFPDENEYDSFLTKHGGSSNAFTELEYTNYHFEVAPNALHGALIRFAQFFVSPLFQAGALEREVQAVDSEFKGVLQSDHPRLAQLMCHTATAGHVYNKFSWGNQLSLWDQPRQAGLDVRQRIIDYYRQQYAGDRMSLVVLGGQPVQQLEAWVREAFEAVPQGIAGPPASFESAGKPFQGRVLYIAPAVKEHHEVTVTFQMPCLRQHYTSKPDHYISHLVGHEGPGSLLSALKARGWAIELCAGVDEDGYSANSAAYLFTVSIVLTEAGLAAGPGFGLAPVTLLFQYLHMIQCTGPQEWVYHELKAIADMKFRFLEEEDSCELVTRLASTMGWVEPQHLLVADYLHQQWQPEKVMELLGNMHPTNSSYRIDLLTKSYTQLKEQLLQTTHTINTSSSTSGANGAMALGALAGSGPVTQLTEPWFGFDAISVPLPDQLTASWASSGEGDELGLPPPNPYIPTDFNLKFTAEAAARPAGDSQQKQQQQQQQQQQPKQLHKKEKEQQQQPAMKVLPGVQDWMLVGDSAAAADIDSILATPPAMLVDDPGLRLWHKLAVEYDQPRGTTYFRLAGPAASASPTAAVLGALWLRLVEEALAEDSYLADVAGLHWSSHPEGRAGFELRFEGFSHKLQCFVKHVFGCLTGCRIKPKSFAAVREQLLRRYQNALLSPSKAAGAFRLQFLSGGPHWTHDQLAAALQDIQEAEPVQAFAAKFLQCCHLECLMMGNITAEEAVSLARHLRQVISTCPQPPANAATSCAAAGSAAPHHEAISGSVVPVKLLAAQDRPQEVCVKLPSGIPLLHSCLARNPDEENCCVEVYYQVGLSSQDLRLRVLTDLADQLLCEPLYDTLRTKQQLGYSVSSGARLTYGVSGFCVVVVSAAFEADEVERHIEDFLHSYQQTLQLMSEEDFAHHTAALATNKLQRDTTLVHEGDRAWEQISSCRYEFLSREQETALLQQVTLADMQEFYSIYLAPSSSQRRKLCIQVKPTTARHRDDKNQQPEQQPQKHKVPQHVHHGILQRGSHSHHTAGAAAVLAAGEHGESATATTAPTTEASDSAAGGLHAGNTQHAMSESSTMPPLKRHRRHVQQDDSAKQSSDRDPVNDKGMRVVSDILEGQQQLERFPVYCTVKPVLTSTNTYPAVTIHPA